MRRNSDIAEAVADRALDGVADNPRFFSDDRGEIERVAERVTHQNPLVKSKRAYASLAGVIAFGAGAVGMDLDPNDVTDLLVLLGALMSACLAAYDKFSDIRATRRGGPVEVAEEDQ